MIALLLGIVPAVFDVLTAINYTDPNYTSLLFSGVAWTSSSLYMKVPLILMSISAIASSLMGLIRIFMSGWGLYFNMCFVLTIFSDEIVNSSFTAIEWVLYIFTPFVFIFGGVYGMLRFALNILNYSHIDTLYRKNGEEAEIRYFLPNDFTRAQTQKDIKDIDPDKKYP